ncbi:MAG: DUF4190 domain-containing protein [Phycisphaerales bacterium]
MTQNPYEQREESWGADVADEYVGEQRLSLMALFSLIFSLICFVPGAGLVGALLGIGGLVSIGKSRGRLTGKGLAITGLVLGLILSVLWGSVVVGFGQAYRFYRDRMIPPVAMLVESIEKDPAAARTGLTEGAAKSVTDEDMAQFAAALRAHYGEFREAPKDFGSLLQTFGESMGAQNQDQTMRGGQRGVPVPLQFERGGVLIVAVFDESTFDAKQPRYEDLFAVLPGRKAVTLRKGGRAKEEALNMGFEPVYGEAALPQGEEAPDASAPAEGGSTGEGGGASGG